MRVVTDASVSGEGVLRVRTLLDEDWKEIASAKKLAENDVMSVLNEEGLDCTSETLSSITTFSRACSEAWNDNLCKFELEYSRDDDGEIDTIFIPISSDLTDNFVVWESKNNDQQLCEDDVSSMFVDTIKDCSSIYESQNITRSIGDTFENRYEYDSSYGPFKSWVNASDGPFKSWIYETFVSIFLMITYHIVVQTFGIYHTYAAITLSVITILPAILIVRPLAKLTLNSTTQCINATYYFFISVVYCLLQKQKLKKREALSTDSDYNSTMV